MTQDRLAPPHAARMALPLSTGCLTMGLLTIGLLTGGLLQGCAQIQNPAAGARVYAADVSGGAKSCEVEKVSPTDGQTSETTMKLANDGGWCGLSVQAGGKAFDVGLLTGRPAHGNVVIHIVGDTTRIDYTPDRGFTGNDTFTVKLVPGNAVVKLSVVVAAAGAKG
jgi:Bacterial Ig domain